MKTLSVLILTQENCEFCDAAKAMLKRLSGEYPLSISTLSLQSSVGQALAEKGGILFQPARLAVDRGGAAGKLGRAAAPAFLPRGRATSRFARSKGSLERGIAQAGQESTPGACQKSRT